MSSSQQSESVEVVLEIDQELLLSALVEALQLLDGLAGPPGLVAAIRLRLSYVLSHSRIPSTRSSELRQLADHHQALSQRVLGTLRYLALQDHLAR